MHSREGRDDARLSSYAFDAVLPFLLPGRDPWQTTSDAREQDRLPQTVHPWPINPKQPGKREALALFGIATQCQPSSSSRTGINEASGPSGLKSLTVATMRQVPPWLWIESSDPASGPIPVADNGPGGNDLRQFQSACGRRWMAKRRAKKSG